jgi:hypothetical protein
MTLSKGNLLAKVDDGLNRVVGEAHALFRVQDVGYSSYVNPATGKPLLFVLIEVVE